VPLPLIAQRRDWRGAEGLAELHGSLDAALLASPWLGSRRAAPFRFAQGSVSLRFYFRSASPE